MSSFEALFLGILQGLTEFIPVSSSGHLVLFQKIFGLSEGVFEFDIMVHLATSIAVMWVFRIEIYNILNDLILTLKDVFSGKMRKPLNEGTKFAMLIIVGCIPTFLIAVIFKDYFEEVFKTGSLLGIGFIITGLLLWYSEKARKSDKTIKSTRFVDCTYVGIMQGIAILPGISRSGSTISGALFRGMNPEFAAKYSFLLSLPVILGAGVIEGIEYFGQGIHTSSMPVLPIIIGFISALISGYFAVKFMLNIISKGKLRFFSYYVFFIGALVLVDQLFFTKIFEPLF